MLTVLKFGLQQRVRQVKKEAPVLPESRAESGGRGRNEWAASAVCGGKRSGEADAEGRPHRPAKSPAKISSRRATPSSGDKVFKQRGQTAGVATSPESTAGIFGGIARRPVWMGGEAGLAWVVQGPTEDGLLAKRKP